MFPQSPAEEQLVSLAGEVFRRRPALVSVTPGNVPGALVEGCPSE